MEYLWVESSVLFECKSTKVFTPVAISHGGYIHEVSSLCSAESSKDLVDGELLSGENLTQFPSFDWEEPGIGCEVDFRYLVVLPHLEAEEPRSFPNAFDIEAGVSKSAFDSRRQSGDIRRSGTEEVEITSLVLDVSSSDKRRPSGKSKLLSLWKSADDRCDSVLRGVSARDLIIAMLQDPRCPCVPDVPGQHELVPHVDQLTDIYVKADISGSAFSQNLLVRARSILADVEVIGLGSSTPPHMHGQLDWSTGFGGRRIIIIIWQGDWAGIWSKLRRSGCHHETEL